MVYGVCNMLEPIVVTVVLNYIVVAIVVIVVVNYYSRVLVFLVNIN
jgi:hypothetical protein